MLKIIVPKQELFDEASQTFSYTPFDSTTLTLEHSLLSISKWESAWHKPFISDDEKTKEELDSYIQCMTINQNVHPDVYKYLTRKNYDDIKNYISDPMTATKFSKQNSSSEKSSQYISSELIYWQMIQYNIPCEFERWHLNRLLTLIKICNVKSESQNDKQKNSKENMRANASVMAARRAAMRKMK